MSDSRFARKSRPSLFLTDETPLLILLRDLFIEEEAPFNVKELAADLNVDVYTVYKMFSAQTRLPAEVLLSIVRFIGTRDHRLVDLVCGEAGYTPMPNNVLENKAALRELLEQAGRIITRGSDMSYAKVEHIEADAIEAALEDIHPRLRDKYLRKVEPKEGQCAACGRWLIVEALTDDGLCAVCDEIVADLERGIIS